ncbi:putative Zn(II)2Cys6 transcription factor [Apodospora peruviana]|uniref:Zn(II)2Cys6 transcription factor n=1 Tax=Apodospora peruviana TaxID=516989 RepID=A0AAE0HUL7_9PEZI|nr:putative Zn(II)2Cys6 transcription factor [Apodospora peruviana]
MSSSSTTSGSGGAESQRRQNRRESSVIRTRQSCDACKSRKTKCVQTGTGPCRYCASTGATCATSVRLQRRPYYRVSEEEYQCCIRLLRHFVPNVTLDLKTMKAMLAEIEQGADIISTTNSTATPAGIETEESEVLQEERGCMVIDARGSYTYVGADSSIRFANALTQAVAAPISSRTRHTRDSDSAIMVPLVRSRLPPATPESVHSSTAQDKPTTSLMDNSHAREKDGRICLPDREICQRYAMRFFDEIQSIYWFYSPEQFYTLVDRTYSEGTSSSASWLCSLYCIFAICSARAPGGDESQQDGSRLVDDRKSSEYLAMAKSLCIQVCDEGNTDAVRALSLLALALHSACFTVTAYLITGMAVRMAYTLGLHRNISPHNQDSVSRARVHRLWWTIYLLDQEVAIQLGYPCAIVDSMAGIQTPLACESILDPGRVTPHGYQAACVALIKLSKKISHTLYVAPSTLSTGRKVVPLSVVTGCISDLRDWLAKLPPHLCWSSGTAPSHRRAVAVLHLRYWMALIRVQRPFLLYTATHSLAADEQLSGDKKRWYEELSGLCLDAADKSVGIVKRMRDHGLLSSLVLFDSQCIQDLVHVFLLGKQLYPAAGTGHRAAAAAADGLETCMAAMRGMEAVGWCEKMLPELTAQVAARSTAASIEQREDVDGEEEKEVVIESSDALEEASNINPGVGGPATFQQSLDDGIMNEAFFENVQDTDCNFNVFDMLDLDMDTFHMPEGMYHF